MLKNYAPLIGTLKGQNGGGWIGVALTLMLIVGCSKWTGGGPKMPYEASLFSRTFSSGPSDDGFRRKIGVVPFQMMSQFGEPSTTSMFQGGLIKAVQAECSNLIFVTPADSFNPDVLLQVPRLANGEIDNYQLAMNGRSSGFFGIMTGAVTSINVDSKDKGFWFFRSTDYFIQVEVLVDVYSTETAAKLFDRTVSERVEVDETEVELIRSQNRIDQALVDRAIKKIIDKLRDRMCYSIRSLGWKTYIVSASDDDILIASGRHSGIRAGHIFNVYDNGRTIDGFGDHRFAFTGRKIGEIEVKALSEDSARATPVTGSGFKAGQVVGLKK